MVRMEWVRTPRPATTGMRSTRHAAGATPRNPRRRTPAMPTVIEMASSRSAKALMARLKDVPARAIRAIATPISPPAAARSTDSSVKERASAAPE